MERIKAGNRASALKKISNRPSVARRSSNTGPDDKKRGGNQNKHRKNNRIATDRPAPVSKSAHRVSRKGRKIDIKV